MNEPEKKNSEKIKEKISFVKKKFFQKTPDFFKKIPACIKTEKEFDAFITKKRTILIVGNPESEEFQKFISLFPVLFSKAWILSAGIKMLYINDAPELDKRLELEKDIPVAVLFSQESEVNRFIGIESIKENFKNLDLSLWNQ